MTLQLVLAWFGGICLVGSGVFVLAMICGEFVRRNRMLRDVTTEIVPPRQMRPPLKWSAPAAKGFLATAARDLDQVSVYPLDFTRQDPRRMH